MYRFCKTRYKDRHNKHFFSVPPRTKLLKIVIKIYKWYVKLTSLRVRGYIYHDMSLISFVLLWYVTNLFVILGYITNFIWYIMICHINFVVICCNAISWYDDLSWFIAQTCADLRGKLFLEKVKSSHDLNFCPKKRSKSWLIAIIYHEILRRYIMICQNDQECLSRLENLSFLFLASEILWYI